MVCGDEFTGILFNSVQAGILVIDAVTGMIIDVNPSAAIFIGRPYENIVGNSCELVLCRTCDQFCKLSATDSGPAFKEIKLEREDGSIRYAEFAVISRIYKNHHIYIVTIIDITEKKEAELLLKDLWDEAKQVLIRNLENFNVGVNSNENDYKQ